MPRLPSLQYLMSHLRQRWLILILVFLAYLAFQQLSGYLYREVGSSTTVLLSPTGIGFAAMVLYGYIVAPAIALAALANGIINSTPLIPLFGSIFGNTLQPLVCVYLLRRIGFNPKLSELKDMLALVLVALLGSMIVPTIASGASSLHNLLIAAERPVMWLSWWLGSAMSMLVISPLLIRWATHKMTKRGLAYSIEIGLVLGAVIATSVLLFGTPYTSVLGVSLILILAAELLWLAFRAGPRLMTLTLFLMTTISFLGAIFGNYIPAEGGLPARIFSTQILDLLFAFIFFILVSLEEQRKNAVMRLSVQNKDLQTALAAIQSEESAKNHFIATLAHELRNPLAPLQSAVELMQLAPQGPAETVESLALMHRQINTMGYLLDDLMDISRINQRKLALKKDFVSLRGVVERAVRVAAPSIERHGHTLTLTLPAPSLLVLVDQLRLEQVIVNLLLNASKFTPTPDRIELVVEVQKDMFSITIKDRGVGIAPEMRQRIFEPFVQLDRPRTVKAGIGIGLSLTKSLVEMHGGTIVAKPRDGGGSEFVVRIPSILEHGTQTAPVAAMGTGSGAGLSVLVVDDNHEAADSLARLLTLKGHTTVTAYDGTSALRGAGAAPDAIILDLGLPDIDGYEVAARLKAADTCSTIIALTGYGQDEDRQKTAAAGFAYHLTKPVELATIETVLESVAKQKAAQVVL
ncbi:MAG: ATP-binding protein [Patescibacteria group bacterium]